eukprot:5244225-Lingulodinium_polyedra.AAC.1
MHVASRGPAKGGLNPGARARPAAQRPRADYAPSRGVLAQLFPTIGRALLRGQVRPELSKKRLRR